MPKKQSIAIIGGGPSALYLFKTLLDNPLPGMKITIYERNNFLGMGMPYSRQGANDEHITNVSDNEIPPAFPSIENWLAQAPQSLLEHYQIDPKQFNPFKVVPRLLFGVYLQDQFLQQLERAEKLQIKHQVKLETSVQDIRYDEQPGKTTLILESGEQQVHTHVIICTGHHWPKTHENQYPSYFDSPYPPLKLQQITNHPIAITGCSLSAVDAIRTLSRANGFFEKPEGKPYKYHLNPGSEDFRIVLHSLHGLFPGLRFHLENSQLTDETLLSEDEIQEHIQNNGGYLSLDYIFENNFKRILGQRDPATYKKIQQFSIEECVDYFQKLISSEHPVQELKKANRQADQSIAKHEPLHWREILAMLSFTLNYPAKYLSAEDKLRFDEQLHPLISHVLAFIPQSSVREMLALANAGLLELKKVDHRSHVKPHPKGGATYYYHGPKGYTQKRFHCYINAMGQRLFNIEEFPFTSLVKNHNISRATFPFRDQKTGKQYQNKHPEQTETAPNGDILLLAKGLRINDHFQLINQHGQANPNLYLMAVPHMGGYNPDYSGLDFAQAASQKIVDRLNFQCQNDNTKSIT